jgi:hypothetical protein
MSPIESMGHRCSTCILVCTQCCSALQVYTMGFKREPMSTPVPLSRERYERASVCVYMYTQTAVWTQPCVQTWYGLLVPNARVLFVCV